MNKEQYQAKRWLKEKTNGMDIIVSKAMRNPDYYIHPVRRTLKGFNLKELDEKLKDGKAERLWSTIGLGFPKTEKGFKSKELFYRMPKRDKIKYILCIEQFWKDVFWMIYYLDRDYALDIIFDMDDVLNYVLGKDDKNAIDHTDRLYNMVHRTQCGRSLMANWLKRFVLYKM